MKNIYANRRFIISAGFLLVGLIYIARLFYLQVIDDSYVLYAQSNVLRKMTIFPARGLIYDRNGELMVINEAAFDLMVIPGQVKPFDTLELCRLAEISIEEVRGRLQKARQYSYFKPSPFVPQLSKEAFGYLEEKLYEFPGFFVQPRTLRSYPKPMAAHVLGYVGEVTQYITEQDPYYRSGDYIGISGIERSYESVLRGRKGSRLIMVDVHNREVGRYQEGKYDTTAIKGSDIVLTIDAALQAYGEKLMQYKMGSIVAIEPATGEILAMVSAPSYNPNLLVGRVRGINYRVLLDDSLKPLFNRALMANYSPGSIFKILQALVALELGAITPSTGFPCNRSLVNCHNHPPAGDVHRAIQYSCNPYFYSVYRRVIQPGVHKSIYKDAEEGLREWQKRMVQFGLGHKLGIDIPSEKPGFIPDVAFYDKWYGSGRWAFSTIYSNSIGQGEVQVVPLQMANVAATIANRGYYHTPHLLKEVKGQSFPRPELLVKHETGVSKQYFDLVADAMKSVVDEAGGTAMRARIPDVSVCGKTGTVQNPHGKDHSGFFAFAPKDEPKIAIVVYVENAGFGGTWAAPIASLMIEKYLKGSISDTLKEQRILDLKMFGIENAAYHFQ